MTDGEAFRLAVDWQGAEDKPFYKALFVAAGRAEELEDLPAFWTGAVIDHDELERAVDSVAASGAVWRDGSPPATLSGYVAVIEEAGRTRHAALGSQAAAALRGVERALASSRREPVRRILARMPSPPS